MSGGGEEAELTGPVRGPSPPGLGPNGICEACRHQRVVRNTRGSSFSLCERSREDARFPRYPRTPVAECGGFAART
jgi:hypothetical protein